MFNGAEPLQPSWIFDRHNFSLFRSRSHLVAKEQVSVQSDLRFEKEMSKIDFQDGGCGGHLGFSIGSFSYFSLISALMLIIKFRFNWTIEEISKV